MSRHRYGIRTNLQKTFNLALLAGDVSVGMAGASQVAGWFVPGDGTGVGCVGGGVEGGYEGEGGESHGCFWGCVWFAGVFLRMLMGVKRVDLRITPKGAVMEKMRSIYLPSLISPRTQRGATRHGS